MELKGVTGVQIARQRGVSPVWVSYVIHGKGESRPLKEDIAKALGVRYEELWPSGPRKKAA